MIGNVSAASPASTIQARLDQISAQSGYTPGSKKAANYCWKFVNAVSGKLFGVSIPTNPSGYMLNTNANWSRIGMVFDGEATNDNVRALLKEAQSGDIIQYRCDWATWQHTAMVYATDSSGITIYDSTSSSDGSGGQTVRKKTYSWDGLFNGIGNFGGTYAYGLSLYRCSQNVGAGTSTATTQITTTPLNTSVTTEATLYGSARSSGAKITQCGMLLGTENYNMKFLGKDTVSTYSVNMWYNTAKYGQTLEPGTTYYYQAVVWVNGSMNYGNIQSFTAAGSPPVEETPKPAMPGRPQMLGLKLSSIPEDGSTLLYWKEAENCDYYVVDILDSATQTLVRQDQVEITNSGSQSHTINGLSAGTYQLAVYGSNDIACGLSSEKVSLTVYTVEQKNGVTFQFLGGQMEPDDLEMNGSCTYFGARPSTVGIYFGTSPDQMRVVAATSVSGDQNPIELQYRMSDYGLTLLEQTTYYYKFFAIVDGEEFTSEVDLMGTTFEMSFG